jgi:two-component system response regulator VicR
MDLIGKNILLAEDDKLLASLLTSKLEKEGAIVNLIKDGEQVVHAAETTIPDIVVMDILLPNKDGFTVLKELRAHEKLKSFPVIFLSNMQSEENYLRSVDLGATDFIIKSMTNLEQIVAKIKENIAKHPVIKN